MIENQIFLNHSFVQETGNLVSDMGGEKVMLSVQNGKYYNLGEIGGRIWELIEKPMSVTGLVTALMSEYEVEQDECEEQIISFLKHLLEEGLIRTGEDDKS
jgi:hypothetical protein